jgi:hypothetical protein
MRVVEFSAWFVGRLVRREDGAVVFRKIPGPNAGPFYDGPELAQRTIEMFDAAREEMHPGLGKSDLVVARVALPAEVE